MQNPHMQSEQQPILIRSLKGHKQSVIALDLYPSCKYIASAGMDNIIFLWNLTKKTAPLKLIGHKGQIHDLKFSPSGNTIVSASNDESLKFWDIDYELSGKETTLIKAHNARIRGLSFSCDGLLLASCGDDKLIKLWSTVDRRLQYTLKKHNNWVRSCEFSPTAANLASCDDKFVHIWDVNTKKSIQSYNEHNGVIHRVKFHSLGNCMATCSHDTKIKLYDLRSQSVIQVYDGHTGPVKSIDFHPNSPYLISSSDDGTTKIWNTKKSQLEYTIQSHSNNTRFSQHGDYFISGGSDKVINIWKTGFYDSLNQKIVGNPEQTDTANKNRIICNYKENRSSNQGSNVQESGREFIPKSSNVYISTNNMISSKYVQDENPVLYDNEENIFQTTRKQQFRQSKSMKQLKSNSGNLGTADQTFKNKTKSPQILPPRLTNKLFKISNQLQFITKTTQILQARVANNGEHLKRLIELSGSLKNSNFE